MRVPDRSEVEAIGIALGYDLTTAELDLIRDRLIGHLKIIERLDLMRAESSEQLARPAAADRSWHYASRSEDPLGAFITKCQIRSNAADGRLAGLSVGLKDNIALAGVPLTLGSRLLSEYVPEYDATIVRRILSEGATILGKLNMYEFSSGDVPGGFGRALNPRGIDHVTGGSSSGSAVAVAAGLVDIAFGGDQGGSIRIPAAWCGIVGFKPTFGLVPHTGIVGADPSIDHVGPMARTVLEVARALECVAGPDVDEADQSHATDGRRDYTSGLMDDLQGVSVGILDQGFGPGTQPEVKTCVLRAAQHLEQAGARVKEISVPQHLDGISCWLPLWLEGTRYFAMSNFGGSLERAWYPESLITFVGKTMRSAGHGLPINFRLSVIAGQYLHDHYFGSTYARAQNLRPYLVRKYNEALVDTDLLIMPTVSRVAPPIGTANTLEEETKLKLSANADFALTDLVQNTAVFNFTGHPAISVPCGSVDGLPVGAQIVGRFFEDRRVLQAARVIEERCARENAE